MSSFTKGQSLQPRVPCGYIRHPFYTGTLLFLAGLSLAIGTWLGALFAIVVSWIAHGYIICIEEEHRKRPLAPVMRSTEKEPGSYFQAIERSG
jgi:protein-S-isoprenylcysteine O-methyltransferase Ste14